MCNELVSTDLKPAPKNLFKGERYIEADLADYQAMAEIIDGADMVVHFGGHPDEYPFKEILHSNILGCYNIWQAAHKAGVRRIVYASSIHAVGMYPKTIAIDSDTPHRPDSYYGLANVLQKIWQNYTGIRKALKQFVFAFCLVQQLQTRGHWEAGCLTMI